MKYNPTIIRTDDQHQVITVNKDHIFDVSFNVKSITIFITRDANVFTLFFFVKWICHNNCKLTIVSTREEKEVNFLFLEIEMSNKSERKNDSLFFLPPSLFFALELDLDLCI